MQRIDDLYLAPLGGNRKRFFIVGGKGSVEVLLKSGVARVLELEGIEHLGKESQILGVNQMEFHDNICLSNVLYRWFTIKA